MQTPARWKTQPITTVFHWEDSNNSQLHLALRMRNGIRTLSVSLPYATRQATCPSITWQVIITRNSAWNALSWTSIRITAAILNSKWRTRARMMVDSRYSSCRISNSRWQIWRRGTSQRITVAVATTIITKNLIATMGQRSQAEVWGDQYWTRPKTTPNSIKRLDLARWACSLACNPIRCRSTPRVTTVEVVACPR